AQKARVNGKPRQFTSRSRRLVCNGMVLRSACSEIFQIENMLVCDLSGEGSQVHEILKGVGHSISPVKYSW
ncbi:hypothetical protein, partial [Burkholderia ubonensis]|uniref:hypothetical protein n=1 Tax=Burkholderia ubonensis TaxID=101571 RepID=UPI001E319565